MILSFKPQFVPKILDGTKIHTIREDPHRRWHAGRKIHFATGVRTKNYRCFKKGTCIHVQCIAFDQDEVFIGSPDNAFMFPLRPDNLEVLARNDGFDSISDFFSWFDPYFKGYIIHWTDSFYG